MNTTIAEASSSTATNDSQSRRSQTLKQAIEYAARYLPAQGPITSFVALNTLVAFEELPFDAGVQKAARIMGCQGYLSEDRFRQEFTQGRIRASDLRDVLREDLGSRADEPILSFGTRFELRHAMLESPFRTGPDAELRWFVAETDALHNMRREVSAVNREQFIQKTRQWIMRDVRGLGAGGGRSYSKDHDTRIAAVLADPTVGLNGSEIERWSNEDWESFALHKLWRICRNGVRSVPRIDAPQAPLVRHRTALLQATGEDSDHVVHGFLIPFCAAFLDQGFAYWSLPSREEGFFRSFCHLYGRSGGPPDLMLEGLEQELRRLDQSGVDALASIAESLELLGVADAELDDFLSETLLALRGWAGMIAQVELRSESVAQPIPKGSLIDFLAVRLVLERCVLKNIGARTLGFEGPLRDLRDIARKSAARNVESDIEQRAFQIFQLAQVRGWFPSDLYHLTPNNWSTLIQEIDAFSSIERRRIFQIAFERKFQIQTLDAITVQSKQDPAPMSNPRFQAVFCLDEREESFRRHLEEVAPDAETFGIAGFFGVAIYYRGVQDAHFVPLCPIVIKPQHWVVESVDDQAERKHKRHTKRRRLLGTCAHYFHLASRGLGLGALLSAGFGVLASVPLIARILFPRFTGRVRKRAGQYVRPPRETKLKLERSGGPPGPVSEGIGFTVEEMTNISERMLQDIGLTSGFARIVLVLGHESNSMNNPHKSAYDCGACGGGAGGPNARAMAQMLNDPRVRTNLAQRGLPIPAETHFVGGVHNTCNDSVPLFDTELLPESHHAEFDVIRQNLEEASARNAHERCRRFQSAPLDLTFAAALRHVEGRSEDLAQTRPEYGHASNAICVVGRRSRTRGLFLDRRAFLTSYDPTQDDLEGSILARILAAAVPVCGGINLCYYFSYVDNPGYGSGVKLPHNVTSLLGVMDGAASDLRTGLPWQGVEIHQPLRLLFVIETTPEIMLGIMDRNPTISRLCRNGWVQTSLLSPTSSEIQVFQDGKFRPYLPQSLELPRVHASVEWYGGLRDHLEFAVIDPQA